MTSTIPASNRSARRRRSRGTIAAAILVLTVFGSACSDSDSKDSADSTELTSLPDEHATDDHGDDHGDEHGNDDAGTDDAGGDSTDRPAGVPEECSIYPFAMEAADPREITLAPEDWPEPPAGSTLCVTSSTIGGNTEVAEYALDMDREEIFAFYESKLAEYNLEREAGIGNGGIVTGYNNTMGFQISAREGGFKIAFGRV